MISSYPAPVFPYTPPTRECEVRHAPLSQSVGKAAAAAAAAAVGCRVPYTRAERVHGTVTVGPSLLFFFFVIFVGPSDDVFFFGCKVRIVSPCVCGRAEEKNTTQTLYSKCMVMAIFAFLRIDENILRGTKSLFT